jgi:hypothetical protein
MIDIDGELVLKSLVFMADSLAKNIGENGARALLRQSGHYAAVRLMEEFPTQIDIAEAVPQACPVLEALGFAQQVKLIDAHTILVRGNAITAMTHELGVATPRHPVYYYSIGLFEGLVFMMTNSHIGIVQCAVEEDQETWTIGD